MIGKVTELASNASADKSIANIYVDRAMRKWTRLPR